MKTILLTPVPALFTGLLVLLAILPWGGPEWSDLMLLLLPVAAIYFWSTRRPILMPPPLVFLTGLILDVLTHGPLGLWAGAALIAAISGRSARRTRPKLGWLRAAAHVAMTIAVCTVYAAVLTSLHKWQMVEPQPLLQAAGAAILAYPLLAGLLSAIDAAWPATDGGALFLRGD